MNCFENFKNKRLLSLLQTPQIITPTTDKPKISFELILMEHPKDKEKGTIQITAIHCENIILGKTPVNCICKG